MNLFRPFRALSYPFLSRGSASLHPWLFSCRRSAAEKVNGIGRHVGDALGTNVAAVLYSGRRDAGAPSKSPHPRQAMSPTSNCTPIRVLAGRLHLATIKHVAFHCDSIFSDRKWKKKTSAHFVAAILGAILMIAVQSCTRSGTSDSPAASRQDPTLQERLAKDVAFKSAESSPLRPQDRTGFHGLAYYRLDPGLRFSVTLHRYPNPQQVRLGTNTGEIRSGLRYGYFNFKVDDKDCRLQVYRLEDAPDRGASLFVPFRDVTSGRESYGAGRYIDLKENTSGIYDLDFNRAYNPSCAYNDTYSCPAPPAENTLSVPIRAGEKQYPGGH
jgi:uncharacterized protein